MKIASTSFVCEQVSPCKSSGVKSPFPTVPICSVGPHCPITIAPSAYYCLPFVCTPIIYTCEQVSPCKSSQVGSTSPSSHCPHMFRWTPLPHCYCAKWVFLPLFFTPIIHVCEQVSPCKSSQVGSNPHSPLSPYVPLDPIDPLLLRLAGILASFLHANHSCP